jgi:PPOX class probable F420-dependent enzyme
MDLDSALAFARENHASVLVTIRKNGRPQLSNVSHAVDDQGVIRVSITTDRAKYWNLQREPWAALHVTTAARYPYVVIEGTVELSPVAADPQDETVAELIAYYRTLSGEHPDWDEYRAAMVSQQRLMARVRADRAYGTLGG